MSRETTDTQPSPGTSTSYELHEKIARVALAVGWCLITVGVGAAAGLAGKAAAQLADAEPTPPIDLDAARRHKQGPVTDSDPAGYPESPLEPGTA